MLLILLKSLILSKPIHKINMTSFCMEKIKKRRGKDKEKKWKRKGKDKKCKVFNGFWYNKLTKNSTPALNTKHLYP